VTRGVSGGFLRAQRGVGRGTSGKQKAQACYRGEAQRTWSVGAWHGAGKGNSQTAHRLSLDRFNIRRRNGAWRWRHTRVESARRPGAALGGTVLPGL
jgi:hypothetical protein